MLMAVFTGTEVDFTEDDSVNCTTFPSAAALWSAVAFSGVIAVVTTHRSLEIPLQEAVDAHRNASGSNHAF